MKKLSILFLFALFITIFSACKRTQGCTDPNSLNYNLEAKKEDGSCLAPEQTQNLLLFKLTGVKCGACGYSSTITKEVKEQYTENMFSIYLHCGVGDELNTGSKLKTIMPANGGIPKHYLNNELENYTSLEAAIAPKLQNIPEGATVGQMSIEGNTLSVKTSTMFFEDVEGTYELGVYLVENGIAAEGSLAQSGNYDPEFVHNHVYRKSLNSNGIGDELTTGEISKDTPYFQDFEIEINEEWNKDNLEVVLVLWESDNALSNYRFINVNKAVILN